LGFCSVSCVIVFKKINMYPTLLKRVALALAMALMLWNISCERQNKVTFSRAFYSWKVGEFYKEISQQSIGKLQIKDVYIKLFEVGYKEALGNYPYVKNYIYYLSQAQSEGLNVIPTIFIRNDIFAKNTEASLDKLADDIVFLINKKSKNEYGANEKYFDYNEIQIDCDWTLSTKDKYFYLLQQIKAKSKKKISCTLRLYPYAFPDKMGVPPVDRVTLMCYNLIAPLENKNKNSILDIVELEKYLTQKKSYPLHLDVALPIFYWSQLYQNNQFAQLLKIGPRSLESFAVNKDNMWYEVVKDTTWSYDTRLRVGDQIKCESVYISTLMKAITLIKKNVNLKDTVRLALFDFNSETFNNYTYEEVDSIYSSFMY
jgi:hypothetical protein